ncbi:aminomethyltransferase family protein, partial [Mesorhizobium sp.]|uniref:aminomethyltransferase family protein n=1 Tax=Mesorhizobium sp. TaxID=1871066 RepID=UPI0025DDA5F4
VRNGVGLSEISSFAKYKVTGEGAAAWLDRLLACRLPKPGRMTLAPMLKEDGKLIGDFTLANIDDSDWFIAGSGVAEQYHMRWFEAHLPKDGSVEIKLLGQKLTGLAIAGPKARAVLAKVTRADVSSAAFPFMAVARMDIGMAPCLVGRVSYTGDLGYEIWVAPEYQRAAYQALVKAGEEFGIGLFGSRALNALRLEKNYGSWAREYRPIYGPVEAGLNRFVAYGKEADFIGKEAALAERKQGGKLRLRAFIVETTDADVIGDEAIWHDGVVRGWVTSGGYAHNSKTSVAMGYVPKEIADRPDGFEIEILGKRHAARIQSAPLFDANFERMRA